MKKLLCIILSLLTFALCACQADKNTVRTYDQPGRIPTYMSRLYPNTEGDERYAYLLRRYDESASAVAISDTQNGEMTTVYTLQSGNLTYEFTAGYGIIAFYELTTYTDGSVSYALKIIDTKNNNKVHSPYKKTVSEDAEIQTRFLCVFEDSVYYLTKSNLLGRCRVMKYSVSTAELTEYLSFDFTENEMTNGSSCTFISEHSGYLTCGAVDGNKTTLKTYDLTTGELVREKPLPYGAALVYMADHDYNTGMYAMYYISAQGDERVATFAYSDDDLTDVAKLDENSYVTREETRIVNDTVYFELQDTSKESPYDQFKGVTVNAVTGESKEYPGCLQLFTQGGDTYGLCFDKKQTYEKMILKKY